MERELGEGLSSEESRLPSSGKGKEDYKQYTEAQDKLLDPLSYEEYRERYQRLDSLARGAGYGNIELLVVNHIQREIIRLQGPRWSEFPSSKEKIDKLAKMVKELSSLSWVYGRWPRKPWVRQSELD